MSGERIFLFGMWIDVVDRSTAARRVRDWLASETSKIRIVFTPNADFVVRYQRDGRFRDAFRAATLVIADGMPLVWASRLVGTPLPERVTGCDLVETLLSGNSALSGGRALSVFLLGAAPGVPQRAAGRIMARATKVEVVGYYSPPPGFEEDPGESSGIVERINAAAPDLLVVGLGSPKQEIWTAAHADLLRVRVAVCAGAAIDFLAGERRRAPKWMQDAGLEWSFRLAMEPRRLWRRYARDMIWLPLLIANEYLNIIGRYWKVVVNQIAKSN